MNVLDRLLLLVCWSVYIVHAAIQDGERNRQLLNQFLRISFALEFWKRKDNLGSVNLNIFILIAYVNDYSLNSILHGCIQGLHEL
jgi:hypothetical protein